MVAPTIQKNGQKRDEELQLWHQNHRKIVEQRIDNNFNEVLWEKILIFVDNSHHLSDITLSSLARDMNSNTAYLSRFFNDIVKLSFSQWINKVKIAQFVDSISSQNYKLFTIDSIGESFGYKSRTSFTNSCKRYTQKSPRELITTLTEQ